VPSGPVDERRGVRPRRHRGGDLSARCGLIASVSRRGITSAAPLPSSGQTAPKMQVEAVRWSWGAAGRVPRLARRRVILFFCPIRAWSPNQTSTAPGSTPFSRATSSSTEAKLS
jgi:hypothetical protein